jgi:dTDP-4-amino-4,6-dideoxygalactose transaminase
MARAIILSGSYMLYGRHTARPPVDTFENVKLETPNVSGRMDHLRAAILRVQLADLPTQVDRWNALYRRSRPGCATRPACGSSSVTRASASSARRSSSCCRAGTRRDQSVLANCAARGVELKWFGAAEPVAFTSRYDSWRYAPAQRCPGPTPSSPA